MEISQNFVAFSEYMNFTVIDAQSTFFVQMSVSLIKNLIIIQFLTLLEIFLVCIIFASIIAFVTCQIIYICDEN